MQGNSREKKSQKLPGSCLDGAALLRVAVSCDLCSELGERELDSSYSLTSCSVLYETLSVRTFWSFLVIETFS